MCGFTEGKGSCLKSLEPYCSVDIGTASCATLAILEGVRSKSEQPFNLYPTSCHSGLTCRSTSGLTEISPLNGRSWLAISSTETAAPVAKIAIAIAAAARLSQ